MKFVSGDSVRFINLPHNETLRNNGGGIVGISFRFPEGYHYLVELDRPIYDEGFGDIYVISMTEHCMEKR